MASPHASLNESEPVAKQERQVQPAVAPLLELHLADPRAVRDVSLAEAESAQDRLELDLLAERHAVGRDLELFEDRSPEHPHPRLAIADGREEQGHRGEREDPVPDAVRD